MKRSSRAGETRLGPQGGRRTRKGLNALKTSGERPRKTLSLRALFTLSAAPLDGSAPAIPPRKKTADPREIVEHASHAKKPLPPPRHLLHSITRAFLTNGSAFLAFGPKSSVTLFNRSTQWSLNTPAPISLPIVRLTRSHCAPNVRCKELVIYENIVVYINTQSGQLSSAANGVRASVSPRRRQEPGKRPDLGPACMMD